MTRKRDPKTDPLEAARYGLSDEYWARVGAEGQEMYRAIRPMRQANYSVGHQLARLETALKNYEDDVGPGGSFELNPDFQRGNVWSQAQQVSYVENVLRGVAPMVFRFNHPSFNGLKEGVSGPDALPPNQMTCIDGLQRITALRAFLAGEFKVFDRWNAADLKDTPFSLSRYYANFEVFCITRRSELLTFYLDLNAGGTVHSDSELDRVRALRAEAMEGASAGTSPAPGKASQKMKIR